MALTGIALQLKPEHRAIQNSSLIHFFSSSTSDSNIEDQNTPSSSPSPSPSPSPSQSQPQSQSSFSSYFSNVKVSLKQQQSPQQQHQQQPSKYSVSSAQTPSKVTSLLWKKSARTSLSSTAALPEDKSSSSSPSLPTSQPISFQELYK